MNKQSIFDNIEEYTPEEIVAFIKDGTVTQEELENPHNTNGLYNARVRKRVNELISNAEPNDWNNAQSENTIESYRKYLETYPNGKHKTDAENAILALQSRNDDADWETAVKADTEEAYQKYLETHVNGRHRDEARSAKARTIARKKISDEENLWKSVDKKDKEALEKFMQNNPESEFCREARKCISEIDKNVSYDIEALLEEINNALTDPAVVLKHERIYEIIKNALENDDIKIDIDDILDLLEDDKNLLNSHVIKKLIEDGYLTSENLLDIEISPDYIRQLARGTRGPSFPRSHRPINIERESTEIYFWGIPSSGKTCAIGLILSTAQNGGIARSMSLDTNCQGYEYLNLLPQNFNLSKSVITLPGGTPSDCSYEMGFDLEDDKRRIHPITCIDFAGEMIRTIYRYHTGRGLTEAETTSLQEFTQILGGKDENGNPIGNRTNNRKIHFFVVEYGAELREYDGLPQRNLLASAVSYIEHMGVFKTQTDAIYLIVTKVDKIKAKSDDERIRKLSEYVKTEYAMFYGNLEQICNKYRINGGEVPVLPFSLGDLCFQDMCKLDPRYAASVVKIILDRSKSFQTGKQGVFTRFFRG